jgi:hypothetical protein
MGLYQPSGCQGSHLPYTAINPDPSTTVMQDDTVFVLRPEAVRGGRGGGWEWVTGGD